MLNKKIFSYEVLSVLITRIIIIILGLFILIIINRVLSLENRGLFAEVNVIVETLFVVFSLGIQVSLIHFFAEKYSSLRKFLFGNVIIFSLFAAFLALACFFVYNSLFLKLPNFTILLAVALMIFIRPFFEFLRIFIQSMHKIKELNYTNVLFMGAFLVFAVIYFVFWRKGVAQAFFACSFAMILAVFYQVYVILKSDSGFSFNKGLLGDLIKKGLRVYPAVVGTLLYIKIDQVMIANMVGREELAFYAVAAEIALQALLICTAIQTVSYPQVLKISEEGDADFKFIRKTAGIGFLLTFIFCAGLFIFAKPVITILAGERYFASIPLLRMLLIGIVFFSVPSLLAPYFVKKGYFFTTGVAGISLALVNVTLNYFLIPIWFNKGAAVATVCTYFLGLLVSTVIFVFIRKNEKSKNNLNHGIPH